MNGVMIVLMIAELIFSIGLGLAVATIHSVLLKFMAAQNDLAMAAKGSRDRIKARVDKLETEQAKTKRSIELTDQDVKFMAKHVADTNAAMAELKRVQSETSVSRIRQILTMTFPSAGKIQARYTYLQDKPWLLPAAWVHRLVKNRDRFGNRTLEIKQIISADKEEVRRLQKLMRSIGL